MKLSTSKEILVASSTEAELPVDLFAGSQGIELMVAGKKVTIPWDEIDAARERVAQGSSFPSHDRSSDRLQLDFDDEILSA